VSQFQNRGIRMLSAMLRPRKMFAVAGSGVVALTRRNIVEARLARSISLFSFKTLQYSRTDAALELRERATLAQSKRSISSMTANGDEEALPHRIACFAKDLPQTQFGEVQASTYDALLAVVSAPVALVLWRIRESRKLTKPICTTLGQGETRQEPNILVLKRNIRKKVCGGQLRRVSADEG
jgi:hypothetical protein